MDKALDPGFEFDEGAVFGDVGHLTRQLGADRILGGNAIPRIAFQLLHAEADALGFSVDAHDLHLHGIANGDHFARVVDALVAHVGDVQQAVDAAQINERTVIGDVLDHAVDDLAFDQVVDQLAALFGAGFFEHGTARDDDVAAATIHLEDLERLRNVHQRGDIAHGADIDLRAGEERHGAIKVDGEAALDPAEDAAFDALAFAKFAFELVPSGFAAGAVAAEHRFAISVLDAIDEDFDFAADDQTMIVFAARKFLEGDAAFALEADVDHGKAVFDRSDGSLDDAAFKAIFAGTAELFVQHRLKIGARGHLGCHRLD